MRKILYSPGFGAGWSSWNDGSARKLMLTYQPIIDALERGENLFVDKSEVYEQQNDTDRRYHPAVQQLIHDCKQLGHDYVCLLRLGQLCIYEVEDGELVKIEEYDGSERVCRMNYDKEEWI